jgi:ABC transporter substrate binding protein (PQQ-dependent alcohol dehydrogenase system)
MALRLMIEKRQTLGLLGGASFALLAGVCESLFAQSSSSTQKVSIPLFMANDDNRLEPRRIERGYLGQAQGSAIDGLKTAISSSSFELDAAKVSISITPIRVSSLDQIKGEVLKLNQTGTPLFLSELPSAWLLALADATKLPVINLSESDDELREQQCRSQLFHVMPSDRMRADALAQTLLARRWNKILMLVGDSKEDQRRAEVAAKSLQRFNLRVVARKAFKLSGDPRERQLANLALLTANQDFDALWVVDSDGEFARGVPYRLPLPRPVVGDAGLVPLAWDPRFDRYGAPQVSKAFARQWRRPMTGQDWAAWFAGRLLVTLFLQPQALSGGALKALLSPELKLDGSKGQVLSFRAWDRQLRQPVMLSDGQGVLDMAPLEGVMHPRTVLDSLGADAPEKLCKAAA